MADKRIKDLSTEITSFRTGDFIAVDGTSGTAKMSKNNVMKNSLGNVHNLDEVTSFAADAKILVDSETNGPGAMPKDNLLELTNSVTPTRYFFEMGNISISSSSIAYSNSSSRARTKKDRFINLSKGDVIVMDEGFRMFIGYSSNGEAPYTSSFWVSRFKAPFDCKAVILISKTDDSSSNIDELMSHIRIYSSTSELNPSISMEEVADSRIQLSYGGQVSCTMNGAGMTSVIKKFSCAPGSSIRVEVSKKTWSTSSLTDVANKLCIRKVDAAGNTANLVQVLKNGIVDDTYVVKIPSDAVAFDIFFRGDTGESVSFVCKGNPPRNMRVHEVADIIHSINHRGFNSVAPENTIPAYQESARRGFKEVETDIRTTSDGYIVCIHDESVDRTSDGTGNVAEMTLEELKELDFGSWKSDAYAGTKIPTLEEFLAACRKLGLSAYIEIKALDSVENAINIVKHYGMERKVTWISFGITYLQSVVALDKMARVGYLVNTISQTEIDYAETLRTGYNEVFVDAANSAVDATSLALLKASGMPVEQWTADLSTIRSSDHAVSGFTSDSVIAADILYSEEII